MEALDTIFEVSQKYGKYPPEAYVFVFEVLEFVAKDGQVKRHLTGRELALSAFVYSIHKYGRLAGMVWQNMNMHRSEDLGQIVFHLVEEKLVGKQETDRVEDFDGIYTNEDFSGVKMSIIGEGDKWIHTEKNGGLNIQHIPPEKLGLGDKTK